jgi:hypothetical protein
VVSVGVARMHTIFTTLNYKQTLNDLLDHWSIDGVFYGQQSQRILVLERRQLW